MSRSTQDYIVRQRFSNALPPPPGAPKLLEIPSGGLKQYTMPTYASRLARLHPPNIEADADLGMPIDFVGMPGVFDGDESAIFAKPTRPAPHPDDKNLLRPLKEIGQAKKEGGISFLRRTQYTAEGGVGKGQMPNSSLGITPKKRRLDSSKEDPRAILRNVIKGFDLANPGDGRAGSDTTENMRGAQPSAAELDAWKKPRNPKNPSAKPVDFYPILPDFDTIPSDGGYMVTRFMGNPGDVEGDTTVIPPDSRADPRIETSLLMVGPPDDDVAAEYQNRAALYDQDPENNKDPGGQPLNFQFFLPDDIEVTFKARRAFDPDLTTLEQAEDLYTNVDSDEKRHFRFKHARFYETRANALHTKMPYASVAVVLRDEDDADDLGLGSDAGEDTLRKLPKGAYYAPVVSTHTIRPKRKIVDRFGQDGGNDSEKVDVLQVRVGEFGEEEAQKRAKITADLQGTTLE